MRVAAAQVTGCLVLALAGLTPAGPLAAQDPSTASGASGRDRAGADGEVRIEQLERRLEEILRRRERLLRLRRGEAASSEANSDDDRRPPIVVGPVPPRVDSDPAPTADSVPADRVPADHAPADRPPVRDVSADGAPADSVSADSSSEASAPDGSRPDESKDASQARQVEAAKAQATTASNLDHPVLGRVALQLGVELLHRATAAQLEGAAGAERARLDRERAVVALERARAHLSAIEEPRAVDRFRLARCEEKLGRRDVADRIFAELIDRDSVAAENGAVRYGSWAVAARIARAVLAWQSDASGWRPVRDVDAIDWR